MKDRQNVRVASQALLWCIVLWLVAQSFYLAPWFTTMGVSPKVLAYFLGCGALGVVFCFGIFLTQWLTRRRPKRVRVAATLSSTFLSLMLHTVIDTVFYIGLMRPTQVMGRADPVGMWEMMLLTNFTSLTPVHVIFAGAVALAIQGMQAEERERSLVAARAAAQEAQLAALRFQVNPHFLFNALNAVTSLVGAGRNAEAVTVVSRLSSFFRASLGVPAGALTPLQDELDVIGSYLEIETARFGERLAVEIDASEALYPALVPHFLLQPLVENAVKHGVAGSKRPVTVRVSAYAEGRSLVLTVRDDGAAAAPPQPGAAIGLANVAARLAALFGEDGRLTTRSMAPGFEAEVQLPLSYDATRRAA